MTMSFLDLREAAREAVPAALPQLPHLREAAIETWLGRMRNEHGSARVFEGLAVQLRAAGLPDLEVERCLAFAEEERYHGVLCGAVVEALGGEALGPALPEAPFPTHPGASPLEAALRSMLSVCCLSETVAVALIGAERLDMPEGPLRELLTGIYADECGHANFGWRLLPGLLAQTTASDRAGLEAYLRLAFGHLEAHELSHLPAEGGFPAEGAALGLCNGASARGLFYDAVEQVIVPGLQAAGLDAASAWRTRHT